MYYALFALHGIICFLLCVVILLQSSKGDGLAGAFGAGGAGQAVFGTHGVTTILHKATIYLAAGFVVTSMVLVGMTARRTAGPAAVPSGRESIELPVSAPAALPESAAPATATPQPTGEQTPAPPSPAPQGQ
jgi:preprotein translocase subunit SecG